jgi:putative endonuclease
MSGSAKSLGYEGEKAVCAYLEQKGIRIVQRNYTRRGGEIDIIAKEENILLFCEVKTRKSQRSGLPSEAVTPQKQKRIIACARQYLYETGTEVCDVRFDVAEVYVGESISIHYIENAFWEQ